MDSLDRLFCATSIRFLRFSDTLRCKRARASGSVGPHQGGMGPPKLANAGGESRDRLGAVAPAFLPGRMWCIAANKPYCGSIRHRFPSRIKSIVTTTVVASTAGDLEGRNKGVFEEFRGVPGSSVDLFRQLGFRYSRCLCQGLAIRSPEFLRLATPIVSRSIPVHAWTRTLRLTFVGGDAGLLQQRIQDRLSPCDALLTAGVIRLRLRRFRTTQQPLPNVVASLARRSLRSWHRRRP